MRPGLIKIPFLPQLLMAAACLFFMLLPACGRKAPPRPPEDLAPQEVRFLTVEGLVDGVKLNWSNSQKKADGTSLDDLDFYRVDRALFVTKKEPRFKKLALLRPTKEPRVKADDKARPSLPGKKQELETVDEDFSYLDEQVKPGASYVYRVVPVNRRGVEGEPGSRYKVTFLGFASQIELYTPSVSEDE